jgi:hypothetical protein
MNQKNYMATSHISWYRCLGVLIGVGLISAGCLPTSFPIAEHQELDSIWTRIGFLQDDRLNEVSGMTVSGKDSQRLWLINDSGDGPVLYAATLEGAALGSLHLVGARNIDWEDLAVFHHKDQAYLLIADVGDNRAVRNSCTLYVVREPDWHSEKGFSETAVRPSWSLEFVYEDGPRDCEAVAIDPLRAEVLLITKRIQPPVLYRLPLQPDRSKKKLMAQRVAVLKLLSNQKTEGFSPSGRDNIQPTAMDIAIDGSSLVFSTYTQIYIYRRQEIDGWIETLQRKPVFAASLPRLHQAEAVCFSSSAKYLLVTSERRPTPLYRMQLSGL